MANLIRDVRERRVIQYAAIYVAISWGVVQFLDFVTSRYLLSPALTDLALLAALLLFPSVILVTWNHGRPGADRWLRSEKIGVPINLLLAAGVLTFVFRGQDLGATTTAVVVQDEEGNEIQRIVPKASFRRSLALFNFDDVTSRDTTASGDAGRAEDGPSWLSYALPQAMALDLSQDQFLNLRIPAQFKARLVEAGFPTLTGVPLGLQREISEEFHLDHFLVGEVEQHGDSIRVSTTVHPTAGGRPIGEHTLAGTDPLELADRLATAVREDLGVPTSGGAEAPDVARDVRVSELLTDSPEAFRAFSDGVRSLSLDNDFPSAAAHLRQAVELDPTFAIANHTLFTVYLFASQTEQGLPHLQAAMDHMYRLPERMQFQVKSDYYFMQQDSERAYAVIYMWAELFPDDLTAQQGLAQIQVLQGQKDEAVLSLQRVYEMDPTQGQLLRQIGQLYEEQGRLDDALDTYVRYAERYPQEPDAYRDIGDVHRRRGEHDQAREQYDRALLVDPSSRASMLRIARLDADIGDFEAASQELERVLEGARSPQERSLALAALTEFSEYRGELARALEYRERAITESEAYQPPFLVLSQRMGLMGLYAKAGLGNEALGLIDELETEFAPPFDQFVAIGRLRIHLEMGEPALAEAEVANVERMIAQLGYEFARPVVAEARARIHEARGEWSEAIVRYEALMELAPTNLDAAIGIGRSHRELGDTESARAALESVLVTRPSDPEASYELALVAEAEGATAEARGHLERALAAWAEPDASFQPAARAREALERVSSD